MEDCGERGILDQGSLVLLCTCKGLFFEDSRTDHAHDDHAGDDESGGYDGY